MTETLTKEEREAPVLFGLDELDRWLLDQLSLGLAGFAQRAAQSIKTLSTRLNVAIWGQT